MASSLPEESKAGLAQVAAALSWAVLLYALTSSIGVAVIGAVTAFTTLAALSWVIDPPRAPTGGAAAGGEADA